jgi:hypothetical protein
VAIAANGGKGSMFKTSADINRKDYIACNLYYLKKFIGVKEIILIAFLFTAGLVLGIGVQSMFVLIMCGVTLAVMAGALIFYVAASYAGYNFEFAKRQAIKWETEFDDVGFTVTLHEDNGKKQYTERRVYSDIDKVALKKDRAYIYFSAAVMYYIRHTDFTEGNFAEFCEYLKEKINLEKFKMKTKRKKYGTRSSK